MFVSLKIRILEKLRLSTLKNNLANADKVHEMSPKTLENSTPTVSKGVKFAVSVFVLLINNFDVSCVLKTNATIHNCVDLHLIIIYTLL